jgi:hypothetical protein
VVDLAIGAITNMETTATVEGMLSVVDVDTGDVVR